MFEQRLSFVDIDKAEILKHGFEESVTHQILKNVRMHDQSILEVTKYITKSIAIEITTK